MRQLRVVIASLLLTAAAVGLAPPAQAKDFVVNMKGMAFIPDGQRVQADITVPPGSVVTWVYAETAADLGCALIDLCPGHSTTSATDSKQKWDSDVYGKMASPAKHKDNKFSVRFDKPGTYAYVCTVHAALPHPFNAGAGMKAKVIVAAK